MRFCGHIVWRAWNCVCLTFYETCNAHVWQSTLWKKNLLHSTKAKESWHQHKAIIILRYSTRGLSKTLLTFVFYHKGFNDRHLLLVPLCLFHPLSNSWPRGRRLCLYFPQARQTRIHTDTILQNIVYFIMCLPQTICERMYFILYFPYAHNFSQKWDDSSGQVHLSI